MKVTVNNKWLIIDHEDSSNSMNIVDMHNIVKLEKQYTSYPVVDPEKSGYPAYHIAIETIHGSQRLDFMKKTDRDDVFDQIKEYILNNCV